MRETERKRIVIHKEHESEHKLRKRKNRKERRQRKKDKGAERRKINKKKLSIIFAANISGIIKLSLSLWLQKKLTVFYSPCFFPNHQNHKA